MPFTITNILVIISTLLSILSCPIYICVCIVIFKGRRSRFTSPFYRIFFILAIMDLVALFNIFIFVILPNWGILTDFAISTGPGFGKLYFFFAWITRVDQGMSSLLIALNRVTAIASPLNYDTIWSSEKVPFILVLQVLIGVPVGVLTVFGRVGYHVDWESTAQKMNILFLDSDFQSVVFGIGEILETSFVLTIVITYIITIYKLTQAKKLKDKSSVMKMSTRKTTADRSTTIIALSTCSVEVVYFIFSTTAALYNIPAPIFYDLLVVMTNLYCSVNCFLLLAFSDHLHTAVRNLLWKPKTKEKKTRILSITFNSMVQA